ncbi:TIGR02588 family protein [Scytonema hofmannii FACHB-248]|uniref:TIGR02588 family protein n=1 Tax=Scytonema hofmannii FACHB-248 TaxID=1842502 RepID=A0ABR8H2V4_9CYAN|nr:MULTISPECIES: TIGR02588 family protein [Nostocales]MBD2609642.1 TIGR02588 family protein [Scytonema hofmannii FACHB-248]
MNQTEQRRKRSLAEWVTFSAATLILTGIVGLVCYTWVNDKHEPPILSVTNKQKIRQVNGQFYVPFEIINTGGETAESVQIMAELKINNEVIETGEQQIDFLSTSEREEGAFIFKTDPRKGQLTLRVASYKSP